MTTISVRISEHLLHKVDERAHELHIPRAEYIRRALETMNAEAVRESLRKRLMEVSLRTRKESMKVNKEFSEIEHDQET